MASVEKPKTIYRADYQPPAFLVDQVTLDFFIEPEFTRVQSRLQFRRNPAASVHTSDLILNGEQVVLQSVALDGRELQSNEYQIDGCHLTIPGLSEQFELAIENHIRPQDNTALEGLYQSGEFLLTQCEAEGFRRITYYLDRPDVMARFTTTIHADRARYPVLLSNGNLDGQGESKEGRHWVRWVDPHPKPSYLFALVAGDLEHIEEHYTTSDGRNVLLRVYAERENRNKCGHALQSLVKSMRWDEENFDLAYDLDIYNIVATNDFNMGAMENKGLNIFNAKYVLALPESATDEDYQGIEGVIAHEYFHNWTGNRVTCRDWFQLSLKEGLTVYRDQQFSADMQSRALQRINDVRKLRALQFSEDAGPMAHPVRPDSFIEINNFYTVTVYEKGAEVVRMYQRLLGKEGFRQGMDLYFQRHDGHAVTVDDFRKAMADANSIDLA